MATAAASASSSLLTFLLIFSTFVFFLLINNINNDDDPSISIPKSRQSHHPHTHRSLINKSDTQCDSISTGLINYSTLHCTLFHRNPILTIPTLTLFLFLHFHILITTAGSHFTPTITTLCHHLSLSPSMAAVTLLALGNGAPDVFATAAAVRSGEERTGIGAILSAGGFVSGLVVGVVGIEAGSSSSSSSFWVEPGSFVRDVGFYLLGTLMLFYVYLSGEIYAWQAVGFVAFYAFFVGIVFWMDFGSTKEDGNGGGRGVAVELEDVEVQEKLVSGDDAEKGNGVLVVPSEGRRSGCCGDVWKISAAWEVPVSILLKLTIPQTTPSQWSRFYASANIVLCPLALLYSFKSFVSMTHPVLFLIPNFHVPLWLVVLLSSSSLAILHYIVEKEPPKTDQVPVMLVAFIMSVFWISTVAGELLNCLVALGELLELPPSILGLTVLAWGNSVGDLVADVALARAGQPALAMAGCFAGPMFNMLVGLGTALVIQTTKVFPEAYKLHFHISIVAAFIFLLLSLMGSLLVVTWCRFRVPRFWGFCLVGLYVFFMAVSLIIATFSS